MVRLGATDEDVDLAPAAAAGGKVFHGPAVDDDAAEDEEIDASLSLRGLRGLAARAGGLRCPLGCRNCRWGGGGGRCE